MEMKESFRTRDDWHLKTAEEVCEILRSGPEGLDSDEAGMRLEAYGANLLREKKRRSLFSLFLDQFKDFMILVLIAAALVSGLIGEMTDSIAIAVIVALNAVIGFAQEFRAEKAMAALKKMAAPEATVLRNGAPDRIAAERVVPGDAVMVEQGDVVPADMRVIESVRLKTEEAALTGESLPTEKQRSALHGDALPLGDRKNMLYKGTIVTYGRGKGIVVATGMHTEIGKIASMLQEEEGVKTPLQKRLASFGQRLAVAVLAICGIVFVMGVMRGEPPLRMLLTAISLAVAAIPEALPAVVTISLALGAGKMVRQKALIRKLPAVETLGSVTYICSDKTGTLTLNRMTVEEVFVEGAIKKKADLARFGQDRKHDGAGQAVDLLLTAMSLSNDARKNPAGNVLGDPTEAALYSLARNGGFVKEELEKRHSRVAEIPFDAERKCMTTFHRWKRGGEGAAYVSFTKGAVDVLLRRSDAVMTASGPVALDRNEIDVASEKMAADGLRVLCVAMKAWEELPADPSPEVAETGLTILGLAGMMDPPREEAKEAVTLCKAAGIRPVMITGDHPITAGVISKRLGIIDDGASIMTGADLSSLPLAEFEKKAEGVRVYARVAPEQKLKIVKALQERGQFVAMTGDGVNDAPALKRADIGVAMGVTGTDVAKEAAHMILLDDNFATIVKAVREGRRIFDNIRKFIRYTMTSNSGEIWTIFLAPFLGLPIPLLPIHILWINLVTDGLPGLALAAEPEEKDIMKRPPRRPRESIFAHGLGVQIVWVGLLMGAVSIFAQAYALKTGHAHWQTMVFTVLCLSQMGNVLAIRSEKGSFFSQGPLSNKPLFGAVVLTFVLQMATVYVPFLNPIFKTQPMTPAELLLTLALSTVVFFAVEAEKLIRRIRT
jgi:Ca2+-transporting ATPase